MKGEICAMCDRKKTFEEEGRIIDGSLKIDKKEHFGKWVCSYACCMNLNLRKTKENFIDIKNLGSKEVARELEKSMEKEVEMGIDQLDPKARNKIMQVEKMKRFPDGTIILKGVKEK